MVRASVSLSLLATAALVGFGQTRAEPAAAAPLGFQGARLGMSLQAWREAGFPGAANPRVRPSCQGGEAAAHAGLTRASAASDPRVQVCAYVSRYGSISLTEDVPWSPDVLAKSPRYVFTDGRLSRIDLHVNTDAFDKMMARLKAQYGPPASMARTSMVTRIGPLQTVTVRWKTDGGTVELVDPSADLATMTISFIAAPGPVRATTASTRGAGS